MKPTLETCDGVRLHAHWCEGRSPRGVLILSHGVGEHSGCYGRLVRTLTHRVGLVDVLGFDYRGHGASPGRRACVRSYEDLLHDLDAAIEAASRLRPGRPRFLLGHSNGGLVVLSRALRRSSDLDGLILSNPALALAVRAPGWKLRIGRILHRLAPGVTLPAGLDDSLMTRDESAWPVRRADPLRHARMSAPLFFGMVERGRDVAGRASEVRLPTLMILGAEDPVIDPRTNARFFEEMGASDKTLRVFPGMRHEPLDEIGHEAVEETIADWLAARIDRVAEKAG